MKLKCNGLLTPLLVCVTQLMFAQDNPVTGIVNDQGGMPIPGVNVAVKGSSKGTQTDIDGNFKIAAEKGNVLIFSFIGMKTQEVVFSGSPMKVVMKDGALELEGVVVTALGVKKSEKAVTYSAQSVNGNALIEAREQNLVNALSGRVAGVQVTNSSGAVGSSSRIVLRGASTITGNNEALFVIDGVPFDNTSY